MVKEVELLAPAGNYEAFIAAVENGADAVYLGGKGFNARNYADNFDNDELKKAVEYAHIKGVRVYLTLNTLLTNRELTKLTDFLIYIYSIGIDGVIVQDLGVAKFIKSVTPQMNLHASTQMTIHSLEGAKELEKLGFSRVVLARELSLKEIEYICKNTTLEVEVFVHGALCVSYSGQCLMSSFIGGRSGNRGSCAQPCRLQYSINEDETLNNMGEGYLLSPKDLCMLENIGGLISAGVKSLKVEGRMKRPEYVATVIRIYRKYIDQYLNDQGYKMDKKDFEDLLQVFNRGGFSRGYLLGKSGIDMMCTQKPNNWGVYLGTVKSYNKSKKTVSIFLENEINNGDGIEFWTGGENYGTIVSNLPGEGVRKGSMVDIPAAKEVKMGTKVYRTSSLKVLEEARRSYKDEKNHKKVKIYGNAELKFDKPLHLKIWDEDNNLVTVSGSILSEKALTRPLTKERLFEQLNKLGDTPFVFENINIILDDEISLPVSEINALRREAIEKLSEAKISKYLPTVDQNSLRACSQSLLNDENEIGRSKPRLSVYFNKLQKDIISGIDRVYIPIKEYISAKDLTVEVIKKYREANTQIFIAMPRILRQNVYEMMHKNLKELEKLGIDGVLITGLGQLELIKDIKVPIVADFTFNIFNNLSVKALKDLKLIGCTYSPELNLSQLKDIISGTNFEDELIVYGRIPLMISEYCPVGSIVGGLGRDKKCNGSCKNDFVLTDRLKNQFPIMTDNLTCQSQILNSKKLFLGEELEKIINIKPQFIRLNITTEKPPEIRRIIDFHEDFLENGKTVLAKYDKFIKEMKSDFTKGHYFRGVE